VITPDFIEHNRIIRVSGVTAPDKRSTLATRSAGILGELKVEKGDRVEAGDVILVLEGNERGAMVETALALLEQRKREMENAERLVKSGILPSTQADTARSALASARSQLEDCAGRCRPAHRRGAVFGCDRSGFGRGGRLDAFGRGGRRSAAA
jgi:multidrug efflux system membrane fusion protein